MKLVLIMLLIPLAGAYFIENLTNAIIVNSGNLIDKILNMGGMTKAIEKGYPNELIERSAIKKQADVDSGKKVIVGVNKYLNKNEKDFEILKIDNSKVIKNQKEVLERIKISRNKQNVLTSIERLQNAAKSNKSNLLDLTINAIRERATVRRSFFSFREGLW